MQPRMLLKVQTDAADAAWRKWRNEQGRGKRDGKETAPACLWLHLSPKDTGMPPQMFNRGLSALLNTFQAARSFDGGCMVGPGVEKIG